MASADYRYSDFLTAAANWAQHNDRKMHFLRDGANVTDWIAVLSGADKAGNFESITTGFPRRLRDTKRGKKETPEDFSHRVAQRIEEDEKIVRDHRRAKFRELAPARTVPNRQTIYSFRDTGE